MRQLKTHVGTYAKLSSVAVIKDQFIAIHILEVCLQCEEAGLPEDLWSRRKVPMRIQEKVARLAAEYGIYKQEFSIAIAIEVKCPKDGRYADLISL